MDFDFVWISSGAMTKWHARLPLNAEYNCFARHIAQCYVHMNQTGMMAQRVALRNQNQNATSVAQVPIPIAGRIVSCAIPKRRKKDNIKRRKPN